MYESIWLNMQNISSIWSYENAIQDVAFDGVTSQRQTQSKMVAP